MKKRSHGKIDRLPKEIKLEVENRLIEGHTYAEIAEYLRKMGQEIHPMSISRYGRPFLQKFEAVRMAKDYAKALSEDNIDRPTTELHEANNALISQMLMEMIMDDSIGYEERMKAAKSIAQLQSAQVRNEKLKIDSRKAAGDIHIAFNKLKAQVFEEIHNEHPEIASKIIEIADTIVHEME